MQEEVQKVRELVKYLANKYHVDIIAFKIEDSISKVWSTSNIEYDVSLDSHVLEYMHKSSFKHIVCIVDNEVAENFTIMDDVLLIFNLAIT